MNGHCTCRPTWLISLLRGLFLMISFIDSISIFQLPFRNQSNTTQPEILKKNYSDTECNCLLVDIKFHAIITVYERHLQMKSLWEWSPLPLHYFPQKPTITSLSLYSSAAPADLTPETRDGSCNACSSLTQIVVSWKCRHYRCTDAIILLIGKRNYCVVQMGSPSGGVFCSIVSHPPLPANLCPHSLPSPFHFSGLHFSQGSRLVREVF